MTNFKWTRVEKKLEQAGEKASEVVDNVFDAVDEIFKTTGEALKDLGKEIVNKIQTDNMTIKINGKDVVINGDVTSVKLNGKFVYKSEE